MKIKFLHIEKSKIFYALVLLLISSITFVYAGSVWCSYYRQGTISAYSNWYQNQYCEWLDFKVTMDEITTGRRLLCTIEEKHYSTGDLVDTLWEGYLSQGYSSSTVQPNDSFQDKNRRISIPEITPPFFLQPELCIVTP
jgi:hypothetical protein